MRKEIDIYTELNKIVKAMKVPIDIISISAEVNGTQTVIVDSITIFDNLSRVIKLTNGMIVNINDVNYSISNVVYEPSVKSFDVKTTSLTNESSFFVAANFQTGSQKEINSILASQSGEEDRFPLIWLLPPKDLDQNQVVLDFTASVTLVYIHKVTTTERTVNSIDNNFIPILQPLRTLFEAWMQSSDFNYMLEFYGFEKPIDSRESDLHNYGNEDKSKSIIGATTTDAKAIEYNLNFKIQC